MQTLEQQYTSQDRSGTDLEIYYKTLKTLPTSDQLKIMSIIEYLVNVIPSMGRLSALELIGKLGLWLNTHN